jgi:hypothetical protein
MKGPHFPCWTAAFLVLALFLMLPPPVQAGKWTFEGRKYYDPLTAGVREPQTSALALAKVTRMAFMVEDDNPRLAWDIDLGVELPLFGWESEDSLGGRVSDGEFGVGLWVPIDFHMIEDLVDDSAPIINTDYRFGGIIKLQYGLSADEWLAMRIFVGHESTHLGDEFSIIGQRVFPRSFERINVSWEFLDVGMLYERETWSVRGGVTATLPFRDTYYQTGPGTVTRSPIGSVTESTNWIDPYAGFEAEWEKPKWTSYLSGELRWRSVYDYHKVRPDAAEERQSSVNLIAGLKKTGNDNGFGRASPFARFYYGVNPHGQFRNQKDFKEFGIGLRLAR